MAIEETPHRAYVVAEISEPVRSQVQAMRKKLATLTARLPVEITLAGSSGLGPIPAGSDLRLIAGETDRIASEIKSFSTAFAGIRSFPNTAIFYLAPVDPLPFASVHQILRRSKIPFSKSDFPFTPHCTLRGGSPLSPKQADEIASLPFPTAEFRIDALSVYALDGATFTCTLLHQRKIAP